MKLDESIGYLIARAHKSIRRKFMAILKDFDLTERQYQVLHRLHEEEDGLPAHELVDRLFSDSSTIVAIIDRLEEKGLVRREGNPDDRRMKHIFLTDKSREMMPKLLHRTRELELAKRSELTPKEIEVLKSALTKLFEFGMNDEKGVPDD